MRRDLKFSWRAAAIVGASLTVFFGLVVLMDYRVGGVEKFGLSPRRLVQGSAVDPDLSLAEIEARMSERITDPDIFGPDAGNREFEIRGCIATYRVEISKQVCENGEASWWWKRETFFDLRLLETTPWSVDTHEMRHGRGAGKSSVRWKFHPEAAKRLEAMYWEYTSLVREMEARYPRDVPERLRLLNEESRQRLQDRLLQTNGRRWFYCNNLTMLVPEWKEEVSVFVRNEDALEVIDLMHAYASRACPFDRAALE
jgi:hypothetical protein